MSANNSILPVTEIFEAKIIHHEERANSSPDNLPNFINPLSSNKEAGNNNFTSKEATSQLDRIDFVEAMRKKISAHEIDKDWNLVRRRELNEKKTIMSMRSFKRRIAPDESIIKHRAHLCAYGGMQQWGVNYWETY